MWVYERAVSVCVWGAGADNRPSAALLGLRMRPSLCASCLRDEKCDEIWMMTLTSGRSMLLSPTLLMNRVEMLGSCWKWWRNSRRSVSDVAP